MSSGSGGGGGGGKDIRTPCTVALALRKMQRHLKLAQNAPFDGGARQRRDRGGEHGTRFGIGNALAHQLRLGFRRQLQLLKDGAHAAAGLGKAGRQAAFRVLADRAGPHAVLGHHEAVVQLRGVHEDDENSAVRKHAWRAGRGGGA